MPTVSVGRDRLFAALGKTYSHQDFDELCFRFGIELDDVTTQKAIIRKERHLEEEEEGGAGEDEQVIYKIEVAANRYDLLSLEGLAQALRVFNNPKELPVYTLADIKEELMLKMHVKPETSFIRPFVVCAVLRGVTFDEASYNSFIDLQDKLHQNICREGISYKPLIWCQNVQTISQPSDLREAKEMITRVTIFEAISLESAE